MDDVKLNKREKKQEKPLYISQQFAKRRLTKYESNNITVDKKFIV